MLQDTTLVLSKMGLEHCLRFVVDAFHDVFVGSYANYLSLLYIIIINQIPKKVRRMARMVMAKRTIGSTRMKRTRARVVKMPSSGR